MCDTFRPLKLTTLSRDLDDPAYAYSWYEEEAETLDDGVSGRRPAAAEPFSWRDGERLVHFGRGIAAEAVDLLGGPGYALLTTERAAGAAPHVAEAAGSVHVVGSGLVDELAAEPARERPRRPHRGARRRAGGRRGQGDRGGAAAAATAARRSAPWRCRPRSRARR